MTADWVSLQSAHFGALRERTDPYLWLADALAYVDQGGARAGADESFAVSVQLTPELAASPPVIAGLDLAAAHHGSCFRTGRARMAAYAVLIATPGVLRAVYATPTRPQRMPRPWVTSLAPQQVPGRPGPPAEHRKSRVLLGVVDSGCPFAHADLRSAAGGTRIRALWDQGSGATWAGRGAAPADFGYGKVLNGGDLEALMALSTREIDAYRACGYGQVLRRVSHGAHALGSLAGGRVWHLGPAPEKARSLRPLASSVDVAGQADIAFVQLPHELLCSVSVAALENHALDGCRYILQQAHEGKDEYERVLISLGYESWIGPHDGSSWFEQALDALIEEGAGKGLQVFLIAGNSKARQAHAVARTGQKRLALTMAVPPALEVPTWLEFWLPESLVHMRLTVTPPGCEALPPLSWGSALAWPAVDAAHLSVVTHLASDTGGSGRLVLVRVAPTQARSGASSAAPHGLWNFVLQADDGAVLDGAHAYIGRSDASWGHDPHSRQASFVGRSAAQQPQDLYGTLNGHAGGRRAHVSGAFHSAAFPGVNKLRGRSMPYSGSGPLRNAARVGPDDALAVDDGLYHPGILAMGHTSAALFRLSGTSVAAPLRARVAANGVRVPRGMPDKELGETAIERD